MKAAEQDFKENYLGLCPITKIPYRPTSLWRIKRHEITPFFTSEANLCGSNGTTGEQKIQVSCELRCLELVRGRIIRTCALEWEPAAKMCGRNSEWAPTQGKSNLKMNTSNKVVLVSVKPQKDESQERSPYNKRSRWRLASMDIKGIQEWKPTDLTLKTVSGWGQNGARWVRVGGGRAQKKPGSLATCFSPVEGLCTNTGGIASDPIRRVRHLVVVKSRGTKGRWGLTSPGSSVFRNHYKMDKKQYRKSVLWLVLLNDIYIPASIFFLWR